MRSSRPAIFFFTRESMQCSRGSTFYIVVVVVVVVVVVGWWWWWMLCSIIANFVMVARQVVYCKFRHGKVRVIIVGKKSKQ
jgi:uncharacterized membrane-anchored protein YitT (DUF2179 family)